MHTILVGVVITTTPISHQMKCAAHVEVVKQKYSFHINHHRFASTSTTITSTPMDILAPTSTFSTTTKTSRTTVTHKLTHRNSQRPVCAALVEEVRAGLLEQSNRAKLRIVVKTYQANNLTRRVNLVRHTMYPDVDSTILRVSTRQSCVVNAVEVF